MATAESIRDYALGLRRWHPPGDPVRTLIDMVLAHAEREGRGMISDETVLKALSERPELGFHWLEHDIEMKLNAGQQRKRKARIGR